MLRRCLESLARQSWRDFEVVVVDNGSSDASPDFIRKSLGGLVDKAVFEESNTGFTGGCNRGIERSSGRYIALINNDAEADSEWLSHLVDAADSDDHDGMWASKILFMGTNIIDKAGHLIHPDGQNRGRGTGETDFGQYNQSEEVLLPDGCAAMYRRELLEETGGFDEAFFAYADDADLGLRARWLGWKCRYVPEAVVYHHHSSTTGSFDPEKIYWVERNRIWLVVKNFPLPLLLLSPLANIYRNAWNLVSAVSGRGPAGSFREGSSWGTLVRVLIKANWDGWVGILPLLRRRRRIMRERRTGTKEYLGMLMKFRISTRRLTMEGRD